MAQQNQTSLAQLLAADIARYAPTLPLAVAERQISQESGWNPGAHSSAGAEGIAQFMPSTAAEYGVTNPYDPTQALAGYARMMGRLLGNYAGDKNALAEALSSYNSGRPTAYEDPSFAGGQTYNYVRDILGGGAPNMAGANAPVPAAGMPSQPPGKGAGPDQQDLQNARMLAAAVSNANQTVGLPAMPGLGSLLAKAAAGGRR